MSVHRVADVIHRVGQTVVLPVYPVQTAEDAPPGPDHRQGGQHPGPPPPGPSAPGQPLLHQGLHLRPLALAQLRLLRPLIAAQQLLQQLQLVLGELRRLRDLLHPQQPAHRHLEQAAQGHQLLDLRQGGVTLPLIHGLPGYPQLRPQALLGQLPLLPLGGDALSCGHGPSSPRLHPIRRPPVLPPPGGFLSANPWFTSRQSP